MAFDQSLIGTNGNDNLFLFNAGELQLLVEALAGNDNVQIDSDLSFSSINLDGNDDTLLITSSTSVTPTIRSSTVRAGSGNDTVTIQTQRAADNQIWGDFGSDDIQLSSTPGNFNASFVRTTVLGDNGSLDPKEGIDTVYIDSTVARFNQSLVNLNGNGNNLVAPVQDAVTDFVLNGDALNLLSLGLEGMLVQAGEVYESTFRGGEGSDWIVFDSFFNPFGGAAGTTALDTSLVSGNAGDDATAILRNVDNSTVNGGAGDDYITSVNGTNRFAKFNGNIGADLINVVDGLSQNTSYYGGKGNDVLSITSAEFSDSVVSGDDEDDNINFLAIQSSSTTLLGGNGDDEVDDYSTAIRTLGNVLDGGAGDDVLRQAANIIFAGPLDFGSTIIGGTGADVMTGESSTQFIEPKGAELNGAGTAIFIEGASADFFSFSFGDSVINNQGVGHDEITDFDSNASFYFSQDSVAPASINPNDPFAYFYRAGGNVADGAVIGGPAGPLPIDALGVLERDVISLTNGNIKFGESTVLPNGGGAAVVNNNGLVQSGVDNLTEFVQAGSQQLVSGAAIVWTQFPNPFTPPAPFNQPTFRSSWLFISDGDGVLDDSDLLIELRNVAFDATSTNAGLRINGGDITDMVFV